MTCVELILIISNSFLVDFAPETIQLSLVSHLNFSDQNDKLIDIHCFLFLLSHSQYAMETRKPGCVWRNSHVFITTSSTMNASRLPTEDVAETETIGRARLIVGDIASKSQHLCERKSGRNHDLPEEITIYRKNSRPL